MRLITLTLVSLSFAPAAWADVITVDAAGGGDHTTVSAAVDAAQDGDLILVAPGHYVEPGYVGINGKALTIAGDGGVPTLQPGVLIRNLTGGRHVILQNLSLFGLSSTQSAAAWPGLVLRDNINHVRVQDTTVNGGWGASNAFPDGATAIDALNAASLAMVGGGAEGGYGQFSPDLGFKCGHGGAAIDMTGGKLSLANANARGGDGGSNEVGGWPQGGDGGVGLRSFATDVFLSVDSNVRGGDGGIAHNGGAGGHGLVLETGVQALSMSGTNTAGGYGGWSDDGPDGPDGEDLVDAFGSLVQLTGAGRRFTVTSPVREGASGVFDFMGKPTDVALLFISLDLHMAPFPGYQGVLLLAPPLIGPVAIPTGDVTVPFVAPELGPGLEHADLFVQAAFLGAGGGTFLGPGRVLTLVDAAL